MLDRTVFAQTMAMLFEMYDRQPSKAIMEGYYLVLQDMSNEEFQESVKNVLSGRKYATLPKPAEILGALTPDTESFATLAVMDIERAIAKGGAYRSITFEDVVVNSVVDHLGGWIAICQMSLNDWKFAKKEIPKLYELYAKRGNHPHHLVGIAEQSNGGVKEITPVSAGYQLPKIKTLPALNPSKRDVIGLIRNSRVAS